MDNPCIAISNNIVLVHSLMFPTKIRQKQHETRDIMIFLSLCFSSSKRQPIKVCKV